MLLVMLSKFYSPVAINVYIWVSGIAFAILRGSWLTEGDTLWETRDGLDQLAQGHPSYVDSWSWLLQGESWVPNSWLFNLLLAVFYKYLGGVVGLSILTVILSFILFLFVKLILNHTRLNRASQLGILWIIGIAIFSWLNLRPQIIDYIAIVAFVYIAIKMRESQKKEIVKFTILVITAIPILIIWQNFHLTGAVGVIFLAFIAFLILRFVWWKRILLAACMAIILFPILLLTPYGLDGVLKTFEVANASSNVIIEWLNITQIWGLAFRNNYLIMAILFSAEWLVGFIFCYIATTKKQWWLVAGLAVLGVASFIAIRFIPYFILLTIFVLLLPDAQVAKKREQNKNWKGLIARCKNAMLTLTPIFTALLLVVSILYIWFQVTSNTILESEDDQKAIEAIPTNSRVLTGIPSNAGYVILTRPDVLIALDGRNDLYGKDRYQDISDLFSTYTTPVDLHTYLDQYNINVYMALPDRDNASQETTISGILGSFGWKREQFGTAYLYVKPDM